MVLAELVEDAKIMGMAFHLMQTAICGGDLSCDSLVGQPFKILNMDIHISAYGGGRPVLLRGLAQIEKTAWTSLSLEVGCSNTAAFTWQWQPSVGAKQRENLGRTYQW